MPQRFCAPAPPIAYLTCVVLRWRDASVLLIAMLLLPMDASAGGYGAYTHGYGIKSLGFAGLGFVLAEDTYTLASNPAGAVAMGERFDVGLDYENPHPSASVRGNLLGSDEEYASRARLFFVPQIGASMAVSERASIGATAFFAGFGTDYKRSPFERFGGDSRITLGIAQAGVSAALGYLVAPRHALGLSLNLSYQVIELKGGDVFALISQDREHFSNQGKEGSFGAGFTLGWLGAITPELTGALSYRSKTWSQRFDDYAGLLPDRGRFDFPAIYGGGLSWEFVPGWMAAFEFQRVLYAAELATGNEFRDFIFGPRLGSKDGPGFGWNNQNIYKYGLAGQVSPRLILRGGYSHGTPNIPASQTLFGSLGPSFGQQQYTLGSTLRLSARWEVSAYAAYTPKHRLRGEGSIPLLLGGGEIDLESTEYSAGFSLGRTFGD